MFDALFCKYAWMHEYITILILDLIWIHKETTNEIAMKIFGRENVSFELMMNSWKVIWVKEFQKKHDAVHICERYATKSRHFPV